MGIYVYDVLYENVPIVENISTKEAASIMRNTNGGYTFNRRMTTGE